MTYNKPIQPPLHDGLTLYVRSCIYVRTWSLFQLRCRRIVYEMSGSCLPDIVSPSHNCCLSVCKTSSDQDVFCSAQMLVRIWAHHIGEVSLCNHSSALLSPSRSGESFSDTSAWYESSQLLSLRLNSEASTRFLWIGHCETA